jgi:hypothetical protein
MPTARWWEINTALLSHFVSFRPDKFPVDNPQSLPKGPDLTIGANPSLAQPRIIARLRLPWLKKGLF